MSVARVICRISKPLWVSVSPRVAPVMWAPCRAITTNKDYVKLGKVGGKRNIPDPSHKLDIFLGKWILQDEGDKSHIERNVSPEEDRYSGFKPYITYSKDNGNWVVDFCEVLDYLYDNVYIFQMGKVFYMDHKYEQNSRVLAYQDGDKMRWQLQSTFGVANITNILMEVKEGKLVWTIVPPDKNVSTKLFVKSETDSYTDW